MDEDSKREQCLPECLDCYLKKAENGPWYQKIVSEIIKDLVEKRNWDQIWNGGEEDVAKEIINAWETAVRKGNNPAQIVKGMVASPGIKPWWGTVDDATIREEIAKDWRKIVCKYFAGKAIQ